MFISITLLLLESVNPKGEIYPLQFNSLTAASRVRLQIWSHCLAQKQLSSFTKVKHCVYILYILPGHFLHPHNVMLISSTALLHEPTVFSSCEVSDVEAGFCYRGHRFPPVEWCIVGQRTFCWKDLGYCHCLCESVQIGAAHLIWSCLTFAEIGAPLF